MANVVNIKTESCDVYIGRGSIWGNPYVIGIDGNRVDVIAKYELYIRKLLEDKPSLVEELKKLKGRKLGCFCKPLDCHGDILIKILNELEFEDIFK
jgi:hypothetical protein